VVVVVLMARFVPVLVVVVMRVSRRLVAMRMPLRHGDSLPCVDRPVARLFDPE
jgi:hypothetical protein